MLEQCTNLSGVDRFSKEDALRDELEVFAAIGVDDHRRLAAELERHGREVLRRCCGYNACDAPVAGVENWKKGISYALLGVSSLAGG